MSSKWQTLIIESPSKLRINNNFLEVDSDKGTKLVPMHQLKMVIVQTQRCSLSVPLINALAYNGVKLVICDSKHNPSCELICGESTYYKPGNILRQAKWDNAKKDFIWKEIVHSKINCQIAMLCNCDIAVPEKMWQYYHEVKLGDITNMEGQAARLYLHSLFGKNFNRRTDNSINHALNYGYSILLSNTNRIITSHGYNLAIGIKHHNMYNPYNLSCDIMEPFRAAIDQVVYKNMNRELDNDYKLTLVSSLRKEIVIDGSRYTLDDAIEKYFLDIVDYLNDHKIYSMREVQIAG